MVPKPLRGVSPPLPISFLAQESTLLDSYKLSIPPMSPRMHRKLLKALFYTSNSSMLLEIVSSRLSLQGFIKNANIKLRLQSCPFED